MSLQTADRRKRVRSSHGTFAFMLKELMISFLSRLRERQRRTWKDLEI
jgi:hypothetical protein